MSKDTRESIRVYPESVHPVERWVFCVHVENKIPHWRDGGKSKDEAIENATKFLGYPPKSVMVENGRVFF